MDCKRIVRSLVGSVYQALINNAERGAYVEHMIVLALEGWELTWPWASWDLQHRGDGARIEVKQSAARQTWHKRPKSPESPPVPKPSRVWLFFVGHPEGFGERHGKSYLTRRRRGEEGGGGGSVTGGTVPSV